MWRKDSQEDRAMALLKLASRAEVGQQLRDETVPE